MHLGPPRFIRLPDQPDRLRLAATVHYDHRWAPPDEIWFEFDEGLLEDVSRGGDPWLVATMPLAFVRGESLTIESPVDPTLLGNMRELMDIWSEWHPQFKPIEIMADPSTERLAQPTSSAVFFTGGVDSLYTVLHQRTTEADPIDDLLFVHGFDLPSGEQTGWGRALESLQGISKALDMQLITIGTNLRSTRFRQVNWDLIGCGPALGAVGLLLENRYRKAYISSTWSGDALHPTGSHPRTDPLYSTDLTTFVHYGDWADRIPKTEFISKDPLALHRMRVCWESTEGGNCGRCLKCMRTMIALEVIGKLEGSSAFPDDHIDLEAVRRLYLGREWRYFEHLLPYARQRGRDDIADAIEAAFERTARIDRFLGAGLLPRGRMQLRMLPWARELLGPVLKRIRPAARWIIRRLP